jgi:hypothetical protein
VILFISELGLNPPVPEIFGEILDSRPKLSIYSFAQIVQYRVSFLFIEFVISISVVVSHCSQYGRHYTYDCGYEREADVW